MWAGVLFLAFLTATQLRDASYEATIQKWRTDRLARLKASDGWLAVAGLFWLKPGPNSAGSDSSNSIVLPAAAPGRIGSFLFQNGKTVFTAEPGAGVTVNGRPAGKLEMRPDTEGQPDVIAVGGLTLHVIRRGSRYGIRLRDPNSRFRREFTGLKWFSVDQSFRVTARFVPYDPPKRISVPNILGDTEKRSSPGYAAFTLAGTECRLEPVLEEGRLFFIFRDLTTGKETYPAGRFLYADSPKDGKVVLDFNKAYNPPCAFTPYATCPLPPPQNSLRVRITAGEKTYHHSTP